MPLRPEVIDDIVRRDEEFANANMGRPGGSSLSSGFFREKATDKLWIGKSGFHKLLEKTEGIACREKIAGDIYAYYGVNVPRMQISKQFMTNTGVSEYDGRCYAVHIMVELIDGFKTYGKLHEEKNERLPFSIAHLINQDQSITLEDHRRLPEQGLGSILAVAAFINDIDVLGGSGGNIGFQVLKDHTGTEYVRTVKIDPGYAFSDLADTDPLPSDISGVSEDERRYIATRRYIRIATNTQYEQRFIKFDYLPEGTKREFIATLKEIINTNEATIRGFFNRRGGHNFISYIEKSLDELTRLLIKRQNILKESYAKELALMEALVPMSAPKTNFIETAAKTDIYRIAEKQAVLEQLFFYVCPDAIENEKAPRVSLKTTIVEFLAPTNPTRVLLLKGDVGAGKSLSLLDIEQYFLLEKRNNPSPDLPTIILIELKQFTKDNIGQCINITLAETYHLNVEALKAKPVIILLDGYDEVGGTTKLNIYRASRLDTWPKLKVIISCRSTYCTPGYESWFIPYTGNLPDNSLLQIRTLLPFTPKQIDDYLIKYCSQPDRPYTLEQYQQQLSAIPALGQLITNPFMLRLMVEALPELVIYYKSGGIINRSAAYECFMRHWFVRQEGKLEKNSKISKGWDAVSAFDEFSQQLAIRMHASGITAVQYCDATSEIWNNYLGNQSEEVVRTRSGCPLQKIGEDRFSFIHRSFLEFFAAKYLISVLTSPNRLDATVLPSPKATLRPTHIITDPAVIEFLTNMLEVNPKLKDICFEYIEASKGNPENGPIAAYAITLLNAVGVNFSGMNFAEVNLPEAILHRIMGHYINLSGANLTGVELFQGYLANANLRGANMSGVRFGEYPSIIFDKEIGCISCNHDWTRIAIASGEKFIIWDTVNKRQVAVCKGYGWVNSIAFSPDGSRIVSGNYYGSIVVWNAASGKDLIYWNAIGSVESVTFISDGSRIVSGGKYGIVRIWDTESGKQLHDLNGHTSYVFSVAFSHVGSRVASGGYDNTVRVWDAKSGKQLHKLDGHTGSVCSVAFSFNGKKIVSGSRDKTVRVWDTESGKQLHRLDGHTQEVESVAFSPNGSRIVSGSEDKSVKVWDAESGKQLNNLDSYTKYITNVAFSSDGSRIVSSGSREIKIWDATSVEAQFYKLDGHTDLVNSVTYSNDGNKIASGSDDGSVRVWDAVLGKQLHKLEGHTGNVSSVAFSPDGSRIASGSKDDTVRIWDAILGKQLHKLEGHTSIVTSVSFNPDGSRIVSGSWDNTVKVWDAESEKQLHNLEVHISYDHSCYYVSSVAFSPDRNRIASGSKNYTIVWDAESGKQLHKLDDHTFVVNSVAFSPDGGMIVSGSDATVRVWDAKSGKQLHKLDGHTFEVSSVTFSLDGSKIVSGSSDKTVRVWDAESRACIQVINVGSSVFSVAFNQSKLAIGLEDSSIKQFKLTQTYAGERYVLDWSIPRTYPLIFHDAQLDGVKGLSSDNRELIRQKGGQGVPKADSIQQAVSDEIFPPVILQPKSAIQSGGKARFFPEVDTPNRQSQDQADSKSKDRCTLT